MIHIDQDLGIDYRDIGPWRSYQLQTQGDTLQELIENAVISEVDQDGGDLDYYDLGDASNEIYESGMRLITQTYNKK